MDWEVGEQTLTWQIKRVLIAGYTREIAPPCKRISMNWPKWESRRHRAFR